MDGKIMSQPPIPEASIVLEVVYLADSYAAARYARRPPEYPVYRADELDQVLRPIPERDALLDYLGRLPDETVAGLYGLLRLQTSPTPPPPRPRSGIASTSTWPWCRCFVPTGPSTSSPRAISRTDSASGSSNSGFVEVCPRRAKRAGTCRTPPGGYRDENVKKGQPPDAG